MSAPLLAQLLGAAHDGGAFPGESHHPLVRVSYRDNPAVAMTVYLIHRWELGAFCLLAVGESGTVYDMARQAVEVAP
jgi:hypothetical protein